MAAGALGGRLRRSVFQLYHFSCVYPDLVLRAIKHIFLDTLILPLGNLLRRTYCLHFQHTEIELFQIKDIIVGVGIKVCSPLLKIFF